MSRAGKSVPIFVPKEPNDPYLPNEVKNQNRNSYRENNQNNYQNNNQNNNQNNQNNNYQGKGFKKEAEPLIDFKFYQPQKPKTENKPPIMFLPPPMPNMYMQPNIMMGYPQQLNPMYKNNLPIINMYNIDASGNVDFDKVNTIYEQLLPPYIGVNNDTYASLNDRGLLHEYLRSMFFKKGDGESIYLFDKKNALMQKLKSMDANPYNANKLTQNPFKSLPYNFIIFKSCYPITYESFENKVTCSKNSTGLNMRIYKMSVQKYDISTFLAFTKECDEWREISYYKYIHNNILKLPNVFSESPNFVDMYGYYIDSRSVIDFEKLGKINNIDTFHPKDYIFIQNTTPQTNITQQTLNHITRYVYPHAGNTRGNNITYSGKHSRAIVALTESPNYSIIQWATPEYENLSVTGSVRKQIRSAFYTKEIWESVYFQIFVILTCLQKHNISFHNFSMENNIYIKELNIQNPGTKYWKYIINDIEYYIPNYGFIVMFDSNFTSDTHTKEHYDAFNKQYEQMYVEIKRNAENKIAENIKSNNALDPNVGMTSWGDFNNAYNRNTYNYQTIFQDMVDRIFNTNKLSKQNKIVASFLEGKDDKNTEHIKYLNVIALERILNYNWSSNDVNKPPQDVMSKIGRILTDLSTHINTYKTDYEAYKTAYEAYLKTPSTTPPPTPPTYPPELNGSNIIREYFRMFFHNRIGSQLKEGEISGINMNGSKDFEKNKKKMIVYQRSVDNYEFVLYVSPDSSNTNMHRIITKDHSATSKDNIIENTVDVGSLYEFNGEVVQSTDGINILSDTAPIETYVLYQK